MSLQPRHLIAEAFMRNDAYIPSEATLAKADDAIRALEENGWHIVRVDPEVPTLKPAYAVMAPTPLGANKVS